MSKLDTYCKRNDSRNSVNSNLREIKWISEIQNQIIASKKIKTSRNVTSKCNKTSYDLTSLNTSIPAEKLVEMIKNAVEKDKKFGNSSEGIKILFYGISGGGKSQLARYLADTLNKSYQTKYASDILGQYSGVSEKNIAQTFAEAQKNDSVLIFDEADSFFSERSNLNCLWERTQVNEFLTQLEEYKGIVICTTNFKEVLDSAIYRRFHFLVEFKPLSETGINSLLRSYFPTISFATSEIEKIKNYQSVTPGDFGKLYSTLRFMDENEITSDFLINELCKLQQEKSGEERKIGFMG